MNNFVEDQWKLFCKKLEKTAEHLAGDNQQQLDDYLKEAREFRDSESPESYYELLPAIAEGTEIAVRWQNR